MTHAADPRPPRSASGENLVQNKQQSNAFRDIGLRWVIASWAAAFVSLLVHQWLEPFTAGAQMGLFSNGGDLAIYRHGALQIVHGSALYANELPAGGWFTYPPFAAITFTPLGALSFPLAKTIWMLVSFGVLIATIWRCAVVLGYRFNWFLFAFSVGMALAALDIEAVRGSLWQGQVNILLMAIVVWDLTRPPGALFRGWAVGVAAGIKLTAAVFIPYLLITRQWRAAGTAIAAAATTVALTWLVLPSDSTQYWTHAVFQTGRIGPLTHPGNYSIGGILAILWSPKPMPTTWWLVGVISAALVGFYAAYRAERTGCQLLAITITGLLACTVTPLAWGHHWVWTLPLLAYTLDRIARSSGHERWTWIASTVAIYVVAFMWFNAWLYRTSQRIQADYPTYVQALDAAINQMTRCDKLVIVATHPLLFFGVAVTTIFAQYPVARGRVS